MTEPLLCDNPAPHDKHTVEEVDEGRVIDRWPCPGRKAHANTMIGRE